MVGHHYRGPRCLSCGRCGIRDPASNAPRPHSGGSLAPRRTLPRPRAHRARSVQVINEPGHFRGRPLLFAASLPEACTPPAHTSCAGHGCSLSFQRMRFVRRGPPSAFGKRGSGVERCETALSSQLPTRAVLGSSQFYSECPFVTEPKYLFPKPSSLDFVPIPESSANGQGAWASLAVNVLARPPHGTSMMVLKSRCFLRSIHTFDVVMVNFPLHFNYFLMATEKPIFDRQILR